MSKNPDLDLLIRDAAPIKAYGNQVWYIASPYSHPDPEVQHMRAETMKYVVAGMINMFREYDIIPFSPVLYTVPLADHCVPVRGWYQFDFHLLARCDKMKVIQLDGWAESQGVALETAFALGHNIPVDYCDPILYLTKAPKTVKAFALRKEEDG